MSQYLSYDGLKTLVSKIKAADNTVQNNAYAYVGSQIADIRTSYTGTADHGIALSYSQTNGVVNASLTITPATEVKAGQNGFVTGSQVAAAIASLNGAMHFVDVDIDTVKDNYNGNCGDVAIKGTKEYVYNGHAWVELGDEGLHVPNTREIAGINLCEDITASALATALATELASRDALTEKFKAKQTAITDAAVDGKYISYIDQDAQGVITVHRADLPTETDITIKSDSANFAGATGHEIEIKSSTIGVIGISKDSNGTYGVTTSYTYTGLAIASDVADRIASIGGSIANALTDHESSIKAVENKPGLDKVGTVTSVGIELPTNVFSNGGAVTSSGSLSAEFISQTKNTVFAAPIDKNGTPGFRALNATDIPSLTASKISDFEGSVRSVTVGSGNYANYGLAGAITDIDSRINSITHTKTTVAKGTANGTISVDGGKDIVIYTHATTTAADAAAVKVGRDSEGHVVLGAALTAGDIGATASNDTTSAVAVTGTTVAAQISSLAASVKSVDSKIDGFTAIDDATINALFA